MCVPVLMSVCMHIYLGTCVSRGTYWNCFTPWDHRPVPPCLAYGKSFKEKTVTTKKIERHILSICNISTLKNTYSRLAEVAHAFNPSTWEAGTGGSLGIQGQPGLRNKLQDRQRDIYSETLSSKTNHTKPPTYQWWQQLQFQWWAFSWKGMLIQN